MALTFENPPLLEIIAELRWAAPLAAQGIPLPVMPEQGAPYDGAFMSFAAKVGALGYERVERLVPYGFPLMPHEPTVRLRPKAGVQDSTLFQIGPNMFSANATPPYKSWDEFSPKVKQGVNALFESRIEKDISSPVFVSLRYIDAFRDDLTKGKPSIDFLSEALGIRLEINDAISGQCVADKKITPSLQLVVPISFGTMTVSFAEGQVDQSAAIIMDTTVALKNPIEPNVELVMNGFGQARQVIHDVFVKLTKNIDHLMKPRGVEE